MLIDIKYTFDNRVIDANLMKDYVFIFEINFVSNKYRISSYECV
jgi:hypothetical protein